MRTIIGPLIITILIGFIGCKKKDDLGEAPRLFRPVIAGTLLADSNTIVASWQQIGGAKGYMIQLSKDTFRTIDVSFTLDSSRIVIPKLKFNQLYQVQVKAIAADTLKNSEWSNLGSVKTLTSVLNQPGPADITFNAVRVSWVTKGAPVTALKILKMVDSSLVTQVDLTSADLLSGSKIITGLTTATQYIILLYSGNDLRGDVNFTTSEVFSGVVIDLTSITGRPTILMDTLLNAPAGSTVLLKRGETYNVSSNVVLSKSVTIMSGPDLSTTAKANIYFTNNFSVANGSNIDSICFKDLYLQGSSYGASYVFNSGSSGISANILKLSFEDCHAEIFRGIVRTQSNLGVNITNFIANRCVFDSLAGYGVITVDNAAGRVDNIVITNSTIFKAEKVIANSKVGSTSIFMDNCTINETVAGSNYYIDCGSFAVATGITIQNCLFGIGKNNGFSVRGIRAGAGTAINGSNDYRTAEQVNGGGEIPGIITSNRTSVQLWKDPANGDFTIMDITFPGKNTAGDPKWRQ